MTGPRVVVVHGDPVPQGSMKHVGGGRIVSARKGLKDWRAAITRAAREQLDGHSTLDSVPIDIELRVRVERPRSHYRTGRHAHLLRPTAPRHPISHGAGDLDKHLRAVLDALTDAHTMTDDCLVVRVTADQVYADRNRPAGITVRITPIPPTPEG